MLLALSGRSPLSGGSSRLGVRNVARADAKVDLPSEINRMRSSRLCLGRCAAISRHRTAAIEQAPSNRRHRAGAIEQAPRSVLEAHPLDSACADERCGLSARQSVSALIMSRAARMKPPVSVGRTQATEHSFDAFLRPNLKRHVFFIAQVLIMSCDGDTYLGCSKLEHKNFLKEERWRLEVMLCIATVRLCCSWPAIRFSQEPLRVRRMGF